MWMHCLFLSLARGSSCLRSPVLSAPTPFVCSKSLHSSVVSTPARLASDLRSDCSTAIAAMNPRAAAVLEYWQGIPVDNLDLQAWSSAKMKTWFRGGPEVDQMLSTTCCLHHTLIGNWHLAEASMGYVHDESFGKVLPQEVRELFGADVEAIAAGKYDDWQRSSIAQETVAGIILMDQLTRNIYRNDAKMYALDTKAMTWVRSLLDNDDAYKQLRWCDRVWVYMPLMHAETLAAQKECVTRYTQLSEEARAAGKDAEADSFAYNAKYASMHEAVIDKWGRFPHRNAILGRQNTPEEAAGLADGSIASF